MSSRTAPEPSSCRWSTASRPSTPTPAGLDDCEAVTRWALANSGRFGVSPAKIAVAGESAGGTLTAGVSLRLRDDPDARLAGQVLIYPGLDTGQSTLPGPPTVHQALRGGRREMDWLWNAYTGGRDADFEPCAAPLHAESLADLPPAFVVLEGATSSVTAAGSMRPGCGQPASTQ